MAPRKGKERIFIKIQCSIVEHGIVAGLSDAADKLLLVISTYMKEDGTCFPMQEELAIKCNWSVRKVQRVLDELYAFRWDGEPILTMVKRKSNRTHNEYNFYTVQPVSQITIFKGKAAIISHSDSDLHDTHVTHPHDTGVACHTSPMSYKQETTNKKQLASLKIKTVLVK